MTSSPKTVALYTLGCRLNQFETESIATRLKAYGYTIVPFEDSSADYVVINTCTVTHKADRKSRASIYRSFLPSQSTHKKTVVVTGCYVSSGQEQLSKMGIDYLVDNSKKKYIPDLIHAHAQGHTLDLQALDTDYFDYSPAERIFHTRGTLKVQDGCNNFCSFCIIPLVRGKAQSRSLKQILEDARIMIAGGSSELVVSGVNISRYSVEEDGIRYAFSDLIEKLLTLEGNFRVRISSMEPDSLDDKFFDLVDHPKLCPHLHLCLQSGSDRILLKMKRMYTSRDYRDIINAIRMRNANFCITTDAIVGYPEETESDFDATCSLIKELNISHVHIFPYSPRNGTRAARQHDTNIQVKKDRAQKLKDIALDIKQRYRTYMATQAQTMLVEHIHFDKASNTTCLEGLSEFYIPIRHMYNKTTQHKQGDFIHLHTFETEHDKTRDELILVHRTTRSKPT